MQVKPIIFSAPMIRALLAGRKSQTRRILKPQPELRDFGNGLQPWMPVGGIYHDSWRLPYTPGQFLWVREELQMGFDARTPICHATYASDGADLDLTPEGAVQWAETRKRNTIPSIHMPRWASRLTLEVTEVRVQRLQSISEEDANAEGIAGVTKDGRLWKWGIPDRDGLPGNDDHGWHWQEWEADPRRAYAKLWNSLHGPEAWDANPWVAAITFTTHHKNVEQLLAEREAA